MEAGATASALFDDRRRCEHQKLVAIGISRMQNKICELALTCLYHVVSRNTRLMPYIWCDTEFATFLVATESN